MKKRCSGELLHAQSVDLCCSAYIYFFSLLVYCSLLRKKFQDVHCMVYACELLEEAAAGLKLHVCQSLSHMMSGL